MPDENPPPTDATGRTFDSVKHLANADGSPKLSSGRFLPRSRGRAHSAPKFRFQVAVTIAADAEEIAAAFVDLGDARTFARTKRAALGVSVVTRVYSGPANHGGKLLEEFAADQKST